MSIDPLSLIAGAVVAVVLGVLIYSQRDRINALRSSVERQATATRQRLSRSADARYREAVLEMANGLHLAGHLVPLEQIAVIPRTYTLPRPYDPQEEEAAEESPLGLVPLIPDWPQAAGPYQLPGIPLERVLRGDDGIALLGLPGSGRTVTLALIAILIARQEEDNQPGGLLDEARLPLLVHLTDVNLDPEALGEEADPLEPLIAAARVRLKGLAGGILSALRGQLAAGQGVILADGWDELPPARRRQVAAWLQVLMTAYPGNKLVVAGPVRGYRPLQEIGLAPVFLMPWSASEFAELGRLWAAAWPEIGGTPREPALEPEPDLVRLAIRGNRSRSPLDATLKLWATFAGDDPGEGRQGWYSAYVNRIIPAPELRGALEQAAEMILSSEEEAIGLSIAEFTRLVDQAREESGGRTVRTPDFIYTITNETHLLTEHPGKRLSFTQPVIGAYLAAEALREAPFREELLARESFNTLVMPFLSQMQDVTPYVQRLLGEGNTILKEDWLYLAAWATDASLKAPWRGEAFKRMAQLLLAPVQFPLTRERAMAALVASRDLNVGFVFRQGLKSQDPRIRILAALGLGALGDPETVIALGEALNDENPAVEAAAAMALGAMGTRTALNYMIQTLLTGSELGRRAVAEMLATNIAGEGHDILREALEEQDPATRRAAIYGLELVNEEWAIKLLENAERRDDQWIVRAAAANALEALRSPNGNAPRRPPQPTEIRWLIDWLAERDESVAPGPSGISQLVRALQEGDERIRLAAAETLGALAAPEGVTPLYTALRDEHPEIRDSAYRSLGTISQASGHKLPGVL